MCYWRRHREEIQIPKRRTIAPAITRVHKLFRLRTVVNEIPNYVSKKKTGATSKDIGRILVNRKLSKTSILETADKLKRARDHAHNASLLGLLIPTRQNHQFTYRRSIFGKLLSKYMFEDECPKDLHESAIFTDRVMRLKLTNPYDSRHTYSKFHCRPFLNVLTILRYRNLHISQVHHLLSITEDIGSNSKLMKKILNVFLRYPEYEEDVVSRFMKDFKITTKERIKEVGRSTKPLLDWAQQVGLLGVQEDDWCFIREKGLKVQRFYSSLYPIWFDRLGFDPAFPSALFLIYMYGYIQGFRINPKKLPAETKKILRSLNQKFDLWNQSLKRLKAPIDFDLNYDIPLEWRESVLGYIEKLEIKKVDINKVSLWSISQIENRLSMTGIERVQGELSRALGISIPRRECFQTDLEWQTCIRLRVLQLPATPYQGEFEGETDLPMAGDNPDVVIKNDLKSLIECKSMGEWGRVITLNKRVGGELQMYQFYAEDINANSAVFICEAKYFDKNKFVSVFDSMGKKLSKVVLVTWDFLDKTQKDPNLLSKFVSTIKKPEAFKPRQRILV